MAKNQVGPWGSDARVCRTGSDSSDVLQSRHFARQDRGDDIRESPPLWGNSLVLGILSPPAAETETEHGGSMQAVLARVMWNFRFKEPSLVCGSTYGSPHLLFHWKKEVMPVFMVQPVSMAASGRAKGSSKGNCTERTRHGCHFNGAKLKIKSCVQESSAFTESFASRGINVMKPLPGLPLCQILLIFRYYLWLSGLDVQARPATSDFQCQLRWTRLSRDVDSALP